MVRRSVWYSFVKYIIIIFVCQVYESTLILALILLAMLAAKGTSILRNIYSINRGYEDLANRLNKLGAKIKVLS
jgi:cell division protein FtsB